MMRELSGLVGADVDSDVEAPRRGWDRRESSDTEVWSHGNTFCFASSVTLLLFFIGGGAAIVCHHLAGGMVPVLAAFEAVLVAVMGFLGGALARAHGESITDEEFEEKNGRMRGPSFFVLQDTGVQTETQKPVKLDTTERSVSSGKQFTAPVSPHSLMHGVDHSTLTVGTVGAHTQAATTPCVDHIPSPPSHVASPTGATATTTEERDRPLISLKSDPEKDSPLPPVPPLHPAVPAGTLVPSKGTSQEECSVVFTRDRQAELDALRVEVVKLRVLRDSLSMKNRTLERKAKKHTAEMEKMEKKVQDVSKAAAGAGAAAAPSGQQPQTGGQSLTAPSHTNSSVHTQRSSEAALREQLRETEERCQELEEDLDDAEAEVDQLKEEVARLRRQLLTLQQKGEDQASKHGTVVKRMRAKQKEAIMRRRLAELRQDELETALNLRAGWVGLPGEGSSSSPSVSDDGEKLDTHTKAAWRLVGTAGEPKERAEGLASPDRISDDLERILAGSQQAQNDSGDESWDGESARVATHTSSGPLIPAALYSRARGSYPPLLTPTTGHSGSEASDEEEGLINVVVQPAYEAYPLFTPVGEEEPADPVDFRPPTGLPAALQGWQMSEGGLTLEKMWDSRKSDDWSLRPPQGLTPDETLAPENGESTSGWDFLLAESDLSMRAKTAKSPEVRQRKLDGKSSPQSKPEAGAKKEEGEKEQQQRQIQSPPLKALPEHTLPSPADTPDGRTTPCISAGEGADFEWSFQSIDSLGDLPSVAQPPRVEGEDTQEGGEDG
eukprot:Hpha_TRINITY_DN15258_c0_g1::TRINITY_DN15258_c0_g1_i1::g.64927::m.64927